MVDGECLKNRKKILFVLAKFTSAGIINSQHLEFAQRLSRRHTIHVAIHNKFKLEIVGSHNLKVIWYNSYKELFPILNEYNWIYLRSIYSFMPLYFKKIVSWDKFKIFYDFRALVYTEVDYVQNNRLKKVLFFCAEFFSYHLANGRGAVSRKLSLKLQKVFGKKPVFIMPCCISRVKDVVEVQRIRSESRPPVLRFVYVGGVDKWQCFPGILQIYEKIASLIAAELTIITKDENSARRQIRDDSIKVLSLSHREVLEILPKFDFGFLIREDKPINNLASPIKFLEYTSNGVIPIMSENIGDYSDLVKLNNLGIVLNPNQDIDIEKIKSKAEEAGIVSRLLAFSEDFTFDKFVESHPLNRL